MRIVIMLVVILLQSMRAFSQVEVQPAVTKLVPTVEHLRQWCSANNARFDACTVFVAYRLQASCASAGPSWSMHPSATFRPMIMLHNIQQLTHEKIHVGDVERFVTRYIAALGQAQFESAAGCEQAALDAKTSFPDRMREFAWQSNVERHPQLLTARRNR